MSALKHGFFRVGFMLCDRCVLNAGCEVFSPGGECSKEREVVDWLVGELTKQYGLDAVVDQIYVWRAAMYLIRVVRAEAYEATVGVSEKSVLLGSYISRLDNSLRGLLNDLAVSRSKRRQLEKSDELMVDIGTLLKSLTERATRTRRVVVKDTVFRIRPLSVYRRVRADWEKEKRILYEMRRTQSE